MMLAYMLGLLVLDQLLGYIPEILLSLEADVLEDLTCGTFLGKFAVEGR